MGANIARDVVFRATMQNDIEKGAKSVQRDVRRAAEESAKAAMEAEQRVAKQAASRRAANGGGHDGGMRHFGRIFNDQSTTGLDPLSRGIMGAVSEHLGTGFAIGGIAVAGATLSRMAESAITFGDRMKDSRESATAIALDFAKTLPIIGSFVAAGQNIRELYTGERYELRLQEQSQERLLNLAERQYDVSLKNIQAAKERGVVLASLARDNAGVGLRGPSVARYGFDSEAAGVRDATAEKKAAIKNKLLQDADVKAAQDALAKFEAEHGAKIDELRERAGAPSEYYQRRGYKSKDYAAAAELKPLLDAQQALKAARDKAQQTSQKNAQREIADAEKEEKLRLAGIAARRKEYEKLHGEERRQTAAINEAEMTRGLGAAAAERLGTAGYAAAAKRAEIQAAAEQQREQARIEAQGRMNATDDAGERQEIADQLADKLLAITVKQNADLAQADKAAGVERRRRVFETGEAVADAQASAEAQRLREVGMGYAAERALAQRELTKRKAEIDQRAKEEIEQNRDNADAIRTRAAAEKAKLDTDYKEQDRQRGEGQRAGEFGVARQLLDGRVDSLKSEARMGNMAAAVEAKRLEIATAFAAKREELNKLIRDPNVGKAEKDAAKSQMEGLDAQQARAQQYANFTGGPGELHMVISPRSTGVASKAREEGTAYVIMHKRMEEGNDLARETLKATQAIVEVLKKNPHLAPLLKGI
jgi:hypothetical protein